MTYVFDIDGTLCYTIGSEYESSVPRQDRIDVVNQLYDEGHTITLLTARGMGRSNNSVAYAYEAYETLTREQLDSWGVKYHQLFLGKPSGDIYVDDKGCKDENFFRD
jgi:phosphoglycolate phosphatase-like HAD superfamily hydrolase